MELGIAGLRVMVTAGGGGIGRVMADAFLQEGARVHVCDVDANAVADFIRVHGEGGAAGRASGSVCDVSNRGQVERLFSDAMAALGRLDCLINNAGIAGPTGPVHEIEPEEWDRCINVNLTGQFNCARLAVPHLLAAASGPSANVSMLNLSSLAGRLGFALRTPYAASKWGVIGLTRSLAIELGSAGIRVNAMLPGLVAGDRQRRVLSAKAEARGLSYEQVEALAFSLTSIKEYVTPQQLADLALFAASPRGRTLSGQSLSVCGDTNMLS